jgi:hypothetical protein
METGLTIRKAVAPVEMRRGMLNDAAIMGALEPVEKAVFLASTAKTIDEYNGEQLTAELASTMKFVAKDVGYRITDEREFGYLVIRVAEILKRYYGNLTVKEFKMAFEMCIAGELDDFLPRDRMGQPDKNHYQQFNADYVCRIVNAYKAKRAFILKKANAARPKAEKARDLDEEARQRKEIITDLITAYECYCLDGIFPNVSPIAEMLYYKYLSDAGLVEQVNVTDEEKKAAYESTMQWYQMRGLVADVKRVREGGKDAEELQYGALVLARRKALKEAFAQMKRENVNIRDYFKV